MSCKYQSKDNKKLCTIIFGECQFQVEPYEQCCSIRENYKDWDVYITQSEQTTPTE